MTNKTPATRDPVPISSFGRDHWSTLCYVETRCVDHAGVIQKEHMRCDPRRHPGHAHRGSSGEFGGNRAYPTRLQGSVDLPDHDDWDCIDDLEAACLIESAGAGLNPVFKMTGFGWDMVSLIRQFKAKGGSFSAFSWSPDNR